MSTKLHDKIKASKQVNGELFRLMNSTEGDYKLVNGQLALISKGTGKIVKFEKMKFKL